MRPRRVCRGKPGHGGEPGRCPAHRFNEAPACLPGKTGREPRASRRGLRRFNEAPACLPGKTPRGLGTSPPWWPGFNEAPACLPGKTCEADLVLGVEYVASMRPRRVCRGKLRLASVSVDGRRGFNEAPACLPGKTGQGRLARHGPGPPASMRPRRVCRGKRGCAAEVTTPVEELQ